MPALLRRALHAKSRRSISHRRAIKMAIAGTMRLGAEGIKINIAGRVNGAEIARSESYKEGRIPLHTFRADIDYALVEAHTYGRIGIKCWICRGVVYGKRDLSPVPPSKRRIAAFVAVVRPAVVGALVPD